MNIVFLLCWNNWLCEHLVNKVHSDKDSHFICIVDRLTGNARDGVSVFIIDVDGMVILIVIRQRF